MNINIGYETSIFGLGIIIDSEDNLIVFHALWFFLAIEFYGD